MNPRKISATVLKRSVFKNIKRHRGSKVYGPMLGQDAAAADYDDMRIYSCIVPSIFGTEYCDMAVVKAANNIACMGGNITYAMADLTFGSGYDEKQVKQITMAVAKSCEELGISLAGGSTRVSENVSGPVVSITGVGMGKIENGLFVKNIQADEDIVIVGHICKEAMHIIAEKFEDKIRARFGDVFFDKLIKENSGISILEQARIAITCGVSAMHDVSEGGIFAALWELSEGAGRGFKVDIKKIPIKQSTIEVCELLELNPYKLLSGGALIIVTKDGENVTKELKKSGYEAILIGKVTDNNDKLVLNDDEVRYLDTPARDEIYQLF